MNVYKVDIPDTRSNNRTLDVNKESKLPKELESNIVFPGVLSQ